MSPKDEILDVLRSHVQGGKAEPTTLYLPLLKAYDLCRLSRNDLGQLADDLSLHGPRHLEKVGFYGFKVVITKDEKQIRFG
jgi:hypothetical protein